MVRWRTVEVPGRADGRPRRRPSRTGAAGGRRRSTRRRTRRAATAVARVRLLAVLTFPDTDELEVHLTYEGRRVIGRAAASTGVSGAVGATLEGLRNFAPELGADLLWAEELAGHEAAHASVVACALQAGGAVGARHRRRWQPHRGRGPSALHALNRTLEERLAPPD